MAAPAQAADHRNGHRDLEITQHVKNRQDDNGWARDDLARTVKIAKRGPVFIVKLSDEGTFTTVKGQPSPANASVLVENRVKGEITGGGFYVVRGQLKGRHELRQVPRFFNDGNGTQVTTGDWFKQFFKAGATSDGIKHWKWTYTTRTEKMVQEEGHAIVGNITGKIRRHHQSHQVRRTVLTAASKCRVPHSRANVWTVAKVAGGRDATLFAYRVVSHHVASAVKFGKVRKYHATEIKTATGGELQVAYKVGRHNVIVKAASNPRVSCAA
jgi:hypothetical protein